MARGIAWIVAHKKSPPGRWIWPVGDDEVSGRGALRLVFFHVFGDVGGDRIGSDLRHRATFFLNGHFQQVVGVAVDPNTVTLIFFCEADNWRDRSQR